ncbi:FkbM family methyltransferase [Patescibacteria group bacterium]|nr:FkbM family methyltransferase [Patescibacteria group bacterium]MBU1015990.1 FkbM family methyltransferase [Patescibacteria group bacterium]MBU1684801.1 FkbM family methyltransferase [Patescibacteria group bacterium]MBU1938771.1 FkbM family methyltransferase [Patescibacteria group bacterium]
MFHKEIKIFGKKVLLTMRNEGDYAIAHELFLDHQYKYCDEVIHNAKHAVIDIGGHLGFFSLYASLLNSGVPIYCFEPHIGNFALLKENLKNNRVRNVTAKNLAVSNKIGEAELFLSKEDLNHSIVCAIEPTDEVQKIQTITLEKILDRHNIGQCDLLKIDCEGAEFAILEDSPQKVFDKVSHIFLEYHDWAASYGGQVTGENHRRLKKFLEAHGYKVEDYPNSKMKELGFLWCRR